MREWIFDIYSGVSPDTREYDDFSIDIWDYTPLSIWYRSAYFRSCTDYACLLRIMIYIFSSLFAHFSLYLFFGGYSFSRHSLALPRCQPRRYQFI